MPELAQLTVLPFSILARRVKKLRRPARSNCSVKHQAALQTEIAASEFVRELSRRTIVIADEVSQRAPRAQFDFP